MSFNFPSLIFAVFYLLFQVFNTLLDVHTGLEALSRTVTDKRSPSPPPHLSGPKPLCSDNSVDSLSHQFSKLGPQENTFCCSHNHSFPRPPSAVTCSELPKSGRRQGSWDSRYSSFHAPCESDESQGYSQYFVSTCTGQRSTTAQRNTSRAWPEGNGHIETTQSSSFLVDTPMPSSVNSGNLCFIPFVKKTKQKNPG